MLKSILHFNTKVATPFGTAEFNAKGESRNFTDEQEKELATKINKFTYIDEKPKEAPKKETAKKEVATKVEEPQKEKKTTTKKTTTKKAKE